MVGMNVNESPPEKSSLYYWIVKVSPPIWSVGHSECLPSTDRPQRNPAPESGATAVRSHLAQVVESKPERPLRKRGFGFARPSENRPRPEQARAGLPARTF